MKKRNAGFLRQFAFVLVYAIHFLHAQVNDSVQLQEVTVSARLNDFSSVLNIQKTDSLFTRTAGINSAANLLQNENLLFIKSYGPGMVASSSIRGGNATQTAVTWNGLSLRNCMLGQNDLSLLNTFLNDEITLQYGGSTAMWGNGSVAGAIHTGNEAQFNRGTEALVTYNNASFNNHAFGFKGSYSSQKFSTTTRLFQSNGTNNFPYTRNDGIRANMPHAQQLQYGFLHEDHFHIKKNQRLSLRYWAQLASRNIAPLIGQQTSQASQTDDFNRVSAEWQLTKEKYRLQLRNGFFADRIKYTDSLIPLFSNSRSLNNISEAELFYMVNTRHKFQAGINNTLSIARTESYAHKAQQNYLSLFGAYLISSKNGNRGLSLQAREEYTKNTFLPPTFTLAAFYKPCNLFGIKGSINKLYRLPTFNDMYWNPGGNINLLPESGYSQDMSASIKINEIRGIGIDGLKIKAESKISVFNRVINNWIIWLPDAGGIWSPQNIMRVWSRGMETSTSFTFGYKKCQAKIFLNTNYVLSTNQKAKTENDQSLGRQLIYTPMYSGSSGLQLKIRNFYCAYFHTYTGYRYLSSDNYEFLLPYQLGNFVMGCDVRIKKNELGIHLQINNCWNEQYHIMAQRAMPGTNYQLSISLKFIHKAKQPISQEEQIIPL